ncbi:hypothetical protein N0V88_001567 [Collariella sp. IMI 366227]|nr:hypothetical protein N0V88_001567 [Collariella sp. IMI 366227]
MIVRDLKRVVLLIGPLVVLLILTASLWHTNNGLRTHVGSFLIPGKTAPPVNHRPPTLSNNGTHREIYSVSTADGTYFEIRFDNKIVYNPNIIPHPHYERSWYIVGQELNPPENHDPTYFEFGCVAQFIKGKLSCIDTLAALPIAPTTGDKCTGNYEAFSLNVGPHDARVFYGPENPLISYGSNGREVCFGQWVQDFRKLVDWKHETTINTDFAAGTEVVRQGAPGPLEKNYVLFWDANDAMFVHTNMYPHRVFAALDRDGNADTDLAPATAADDDRCLARYLPALPPKTKETSESYHQATNSLRITMCNRADPNCKRDDTNTFIMTIIQHKRYYDWHSEYEPYVVLFQQRAPYELYAISEKPLWIAGRKHKNERHTDMLYVTSVNWKMKGLNYHGYLDDVLIIGFGVEDKNSGGIDVLAGDLMVDLGKCVD